jgi:hypothetical protein
LYNHGSFKIFGLFEASTRPNETKTVNPDTTKPSQPPVENIQKVEKGGKGFQNNGTNNGIQAIDLTITNNSYLALNAKIREQVIDNLEKLKKDYPRHPNVLLYNYEAGGMITNVIDDFANILSSEKLGGNGAYGTQYSISLNKPVEVLMLRSDSAFFHDFLNAVKPYIFITSIDTIFANPVGAIPVIKVRFGRMPNFDQYGRVIIR